MMIAFLMNEDESLLCNDAWTGSEENVNMSLKFFDN